MVRVFLPCTGETVDGERFPAVPRNAGARLALRHMSDFNRIEFENNDAPLVTPLPGKGGMVLSSASGDIQLSITDPLGNETANFNVGVECGWSAAESFHVFSRTGGVTVVGIAVFGESPLQVGLMTMGWENEQWTSPECTEQEVSANVLDYGFVVSNNDGYIAAWSKVSESDYRLDVWSVWNNSITKVFDESISKPLDIQFSDAGDELYILRENKFSVLEFAKEPL